MTTITPLFWVTKAQNLIEKYKSNIEEKKSKEERSPVDFSIDIIIIDK